MLFLLAWLGGWAFGEASTTGELIHASDKTPVAFLAFWLAGWTLGGLFAMSTAVWQLAGREVVMIDTSEFTYRVEVFGLGLSRSYDVSEVKHLRAVEYSTSPFNDQRAWFPPIYGSGFGPIAFDYGARTIRIAASLEEAEAKLLVDSLSAHLPRTL